MSGKPAARQGDMTQYGGSIVQGSSIGIKTPKRLKKHHKTDVSSTPLLLI